MIDLPKLVDIKTVETGAELDDFPEELQSAIRAGRKTVSTWMKGMDAIKQGTMDGDAQATMVKTQIREILKPMYELVCTNDTENFEGEVEVLIRSLLNINDTDKLIAILYKILSRTGYTQKNVHLDTLPRDTTESSTENPILAMLRDDIKTGALRSFSKESCTRIDSAPKKFATIGAGAARKRTQIARDISDEAIKEIIPVRHLVLICEFIQLKKAREAVEKHTGNSVFMSQTSVALEKRILEIDIELQKVVKALNNADKYDVKQVYKALENKLLGLGASVARKTELQIEQEREAQNTHSKGPSAMERIIAQGQAEIERREREKRNKAAQIASQVKVQEPKPVQERELEQPSKPNAKEEKAEITTHQKTPQSAVDTFKKMLNDLWRKLLSIFNS